MENQRVRVRETSKRYRTKCYPRTREELVYRLKSSGYEKASRKHS